MNFCEKIIKKRSVQWFTSGSLLRLSKQSCNFHRNSLGSKRLGIDHAPVRTTLHQQLLTLVKLHMADAANARHVLHIGGDGDFIMEPGLFLILDVMFQNHPEVLGLNRLRSLLAPMRLRYLLYPLEIHGIVDMVVPVDVFLPDSPLLIVLNRFTHSLSKISAQR